MNKLYLLPLLLLLCGCDEDMILKRDIKKAYLAILQKEVNGCNCPCHSKDNHSQCHTSTMAENVYKNYELSDLSDSVRRASDREQINNHAMQSHILNNRNKCTSKSHINC